MKLGQILKLISVFNSITTTVVAVQEERGSAPGVEKQKEVEEAVMLGLATASIIGGQDIINEKDFRKNLRKSIDGIVGMLKSTRLWTNQ